MSEITTLENWSGAAYSIGSDMQYTCAKWLLSKQTFTDKKNILDLGCGNGRTTNYLKFLFPKANILGIDRSQEMIQSAFDSFFDKSIVFQKLGLEDLAIKDQFDLVTSFFFLDWIEDQLNVQNRIFNSLKPEGEAFFVISTGNDEVAKTVNKMISSKKWALTLAGYKVPAGLHQPQDYKKYMVISGFEILQYEVKKIPVELDSIDEFHRFISALPLFGSQLSSNQTNQISSDITDSYLQYCNQKFNGRIICEGEIILVRARRTS